jgi:hypothetical protein
LGTVENSLAIDSVVGDVRLCGYDHVIHPPRLWPLSLGLLAWLCYVVKVVQVVEAVDLHPFVLPCLVPWLFPCPTPIHCAERFYVAPLFFVLPPLLLNTWEVW